MPGPTSPRVCAAARPFVRSSTSPRPTGDRPPASGQPAAAGRVMSRPPAHDSDKQPTHSNRDRPVAERVVSRPPTPPPNGSRPPAAPTGVRRSNDARVSRPRADASGSNGARSSEEHEILAQHFFKSVGPRTYAAQVKRASNGNHYIVLMEGKRDDTTGEVRKTRLFVFSEDFVQFFNLMKSTAEFVKAHPVPPEIAKKRERFWAKQAAEAKPAPLAAAGPHRQSANLPTTSLANRTG